MNESKQSNNDKLKINLNGLIKISSSYTNLLYRFSFKLINDQIYNNNFDSKIIFISTKPFPIDLLTFSITESQLERVFIKEIHFYEELIFIIKLYLLKIKKKTIHISCIFIDSLDHLLLERQFNYSEMEDLRKLLNKIKYILIKNSISMFLINKEKRINNFVFETNFNELNYCFNDKLIINEEIKGKFFIWSCKKKKKVYLIKNPYEVKNKIDLIYIE